MDMGGIEVDLLSWTCQFQHILLIFLTFRLVMVNVEIDLICIFNIICAAVSMYG